MGPALCLLSAACFGAMAVFGKLAYAAGVSPSQLLLVRFTLAAVVLTALLLGRRSGSAAAVRPGRPPLRLLATALGLGAVGYATQASLYFAALQRMDASLLSLVFYTYPVLVTLTAAGLGRDRLTRQRCLALVVASAGVLLVLAGSGGGRVQPVGLALAFGSAVVYTGYILVADTVVHRLPPLLLSALVMSGAAVALGARTLLTGGFGPRFGLLGWLWLVCIAGVSTVAAVLAFFGGLRRSGPSTAAILSTFEPVVTTALAGLTLGDLLSGPQLLGGLLVLSSVAALQLRPAGTRPARPQPAGPRPRTRGGVPDQAGRAPLVNVGAD